MSETAFYAERVGKLYAQYRSVVKPLLADVEAEFERFPTPIYNEVRSFTDHLSRCFTDEGQIKDEGTIKSQCESAGHHLKRAILDCYKLLIIASRKRIEKFEKSVRYLDLRTVDSDGEFGYKFNKGFQEAKRLVRDAKRVEATADDLATYEAYQAAHNAYTEIEDHLDVSAPMIRRARFRFFTGKLGWIITSVLSFIAGNLLANNNEAIVAWIASWFS